MTGISLVLFAVCTSLILVSSYTTPSLAQTGGVIDTGTKDFGDAEAGDPDAPDGDQDPTNGTISGDQTDGGSAGPGTTVGKSTDRVAPAKRGGAWAHWMKALRLWIRLSLQN
ncbi:MAG: hypothetical protein ACREOU_10105 [Candidatus Eiseniibacteriota bacterium]